MPGIVDRIAIYALMVLAIGGVSFVCGWHVREWRDDSEQLKQTRIEVTELNKNIANAVKKSEYLVENQAKIVIDKDKKINTMQGTINELRTFLSKLSPTHCRLDDEHQQLLNKISKAANASDNTFTPDTGRKHIPIP